MRDAYETHDRAVLNTSTGETLCQCEPDEYGSDVSTEAEQTCRELNRLAELAREPVACELLLGVLAIERRLACHYELDHEREEWWARPHPQLDRRSALDVVAAGDFGAVEQVVDRLEASAYI